MSYDPNLWNSLLIKNFGVSVVCFKLKINNKKSKINNNMNNDTATTNKEIDPRLIFKEMLNGYMNLVQSKHFQMNSFPTIPNSFINIS